MTYSRVFNGDVSQFGTVAVLYGGTSAERSVSLKSGQAVVSSLIDAGVNVTAIDVGENACEQLTEKEFDFAFIALHGGDGEGGKVQALLELLGVPHTGSDYASSALALNKLNTKKIWISSGLPTPEYQVVELDTNLKSVWADLGDVFVKPACEGSSYGISPATNYSDFERSVELARRFDKTVIAEKLVNGNEFSVTILGEQALPAIQIINHAEFYDFHAKYESNSTEYLCPAPLTEKEHAYLSETALAAFKTLGCSGWGRIDFMQNQNGEFYLLEANTVPGMTDHSLVPMAAKAVGLSYRDLLLEVLTLARSQHNGQ